MWVPFPLSGLLLQETVSTAFETYKKVFVSYYDVSKAFDMFWTDGMFWQLYRKGLRGRIWRLMYRTYEGFECCVQIDGMVSHVMWDPSGGIPLINEVHSVHKPPGGATGHLRAMLLGPRHR